MKKVLLSLLALSAVVLVACGASKTYVAVEKATTEAMAQVATATDLTVLGEIQNKWSADVAAAQTDAPLTGEELTKFNTLTSTFDSVLKVKADSLTKVAMEQAMADTLAAQAAAAEAAAVAKK